MRVLDVKDLGWEAALVDIEGETVLLLDADLDVDNRIELMNRAMA